MVYCQLSYSYGWLMLGLLSSDIVSSAFFLFFFFQAEDGIRDLTVTGVQTCALPISVVTDPSDYPKVLAEMAERGGALSGGTRFALAQKAFAHSAAYEAAIGNYLTGQGSDGELASFPGRLTFQFEKVQDLRYGENPHQAAAFYRDGNPAPGGIAGYTQIQGKELSYNNIADADAAWECVKRSEERRVGKECRSRWSPDH